MGKQLENVYTCGLWRILFFVFLFCFFLPTINSYRSDAQPTVPDVCMWLCVGVVYFFYVVSGLSNQVMRKAKEAGKNTWLMIKQNKTESCGYILFTSKRFKANDFLGDYQSCTDFLNFGFD